VKANEHTERFIDARLAKPNDMYFVSTMQRSTTTMSVHVVVGHDYPTSRPLLALSIHWSGVLHTALTDEAVRVRSHWMFAMQACWTDWVTWCVEHIIATCHRLPEQVQHFGTRSRQNSGIRFNDLNFSGRYCYTSTHQAAFATASKIMRIIDQENCQNWWCVVSCSSSGGW